jgi:hypothetical protein
MAVSDPTPPQIDLGLLEPMDRGKIFLNTETGCWEWTAARDRYGYGQVKRTGRVLKAHRYIYELYRGPINTNISQLDHLCRTRSCVNPEHLEPTTVQINVRRGFAGIEGSLPNDLAMQIYRVAERAYKRGIHEGIRQAQSKIERR